MLQLKDSSLPSPKWRACSQTRGHLLNGHPSVVFSANQNNSLRRLRGALRRYQESTIQSKLSGGLLQQESASKKSYNDHNNNNKNNNNNNNSKLITIKKKLYNFENLIPRAMLHHNKITLAIKYLVMSYIEVMTSVVMLQQT